MKIVNKLPQIPLASSKANTKKTLIVCSGIKRNGNDEGKLPAPIQKNRLERLFPTFATVFETRNTSINRFFNWITGKSNDSPRIIEAVYQPTKEEIGAIERPPAKKTSAQVEEAKEAVYYPTEEEIAEIERPSGKKTPAQVIKELMKKIPPGTRLDLSQENSSREDNFYGLTIRTNLSRANLANLDLRNVNLKNVDLYKANLIRANLQNANLSEAFLRGANLTDAILTDANLTGAILTDANLTGADLTSATLPEGNWIQAIAKTEDGKPNLRGTNLSRTKNLPPNADFSNVDLEKAELECLDLEKADLTGANFAEITLSQTKLPAGWIQQIAKDENGFPNLMGAYISRVDLTEADFTGINLEGITINNHCQLPNDHEWLQKIKGKSLKGANFCNIKFGEANLTGVNLEGTNLTESQFNDPNWPQLILNKSLRGANLANVDLTQSDLTGVDLTEAECLNMKYYFPPNWTEQIARNPETGFLKVDGVQYTDFRGLKPGLIDEAKIDDSSLTDLKFSDILWQALDKPQNGVNTPFCSEAHKKLLGEILLAAQGKPIPNENWGNGLSVVFKTLSETQNIHLLSELLAQTRDIDVSIKRDAILTLQNASPEEIKNIAQSIQYGFINQEAASLTAFQYFSLHFSDPQSPFNQAFRQAYKNTILNNLNAKQTVLLNELLKGENSETRIGKIRALETCWKNPQLNLMLDQLFLEDHRNKPPHLSQFLELVGNIGFYKQILGIDTSDNFLPSEALTSSLQNLPPLTIGNYLDLVPRDKKSEVQKLLAGVREEEKVNSVREWLEDNAINCSNIKPKLQFRWHQQEMLSLLSKELPIVKDSAFNHVLNELSIPVENSENLTENDIKTFMQAIAYYKTAHAGSPQAQDMFRMLIEETVRGNSQQFILDLGKNWINQVKQTNPDFNPNKLRIPCQGQVGNYLIEVESSPLEFFNMSKDLRDHSCLNITSGSNSDKVLNHALNLHTILTWVKNPKNGELIGRQLMTISDEGSLVGYPVYLFGGDNRNEISKSTQEFASAYLKFLGLSPASQSSYSKPRSLTGVPDYYDSPTWSVDSSHGIKQKGKEIQIVATNEEKPTINRRIKEEDNLNQQKNNDIEPNKDQDGGISVKPNPNNPVKPNSGNGAAELPETEPPQSSKQTASRSVENISDPVEVNNPSNSSSNVNSVEEPNQLWGELKSNYTMPKPLSPEEIAQLTLDDTGTIPEDSPVKVDKGKAVKVTAKEDAEQLTSTELPVRQTESVPVSV